MRLGRRLSLLMWGWGKYDIKTKILARLLRFYPFWYDHGFEYKKYFTLNYFKGYQAFDLHYSAPRERGYWEREEYYRRSMQHMYFGATVFWFRFEFHFQWGHKGKTWI